MLHICIRTAVSHSLACGIHCITIQHHYFPRCNNGVRGSPRVEYTSNKRRPRRTNGATQTFRRPSHATTLSGSTAQTPRDASGPPNTSVPTPGVYVPPHAQSGRSGEGRYARDQMLHLFRSHRESDELQDGLSGLYVGNWEPNISNGTSASNWGRKDDHGREGQGGVDLCWDRDGNVQPLGLNILNEDEKEVCLISCVLFTLGSLSNYGFSLRSSTRLLTRPSNPPPKIRTKTVRRRRDCRCASLLFRQAGPMDCPLRLVLVQDHAAAILAMPTRSHRAGWRPRRHRGSRGRSRVQLLRHRHWYDDAPTSRNRPQAARRRSATRTGAQLRMLGLLDP